MTLLFQHLFPLAASGRNNPLSPIQTKTKLLSPSHFWSDHCSRSHLRDTCHEQEQFLRENGSRFQWQPTHERHRRLLKALVATATSFVLALPRQEHGCYHGNGCHGSDCAESRPAHRLRDIAKRSTLQAADNVRHWNTVCITCWTLTCSTLTCWTLTCSTLTYDCWYVDRAIPLSQNTSNQSALLKAVILAPPYLTLPIMQAPPLDRNPSPFSKAHPIDPTDHPFL